MRPLMQRWLLRLGRVASLVLLAVLGTSALMYCAPGYFSDTREMDSAHVSVARADLDSLHRQQGSLRLVLTSELTSWRHGDLGESRQYGVAVSSLLKQRGLRSAYILVAGVLSGWSAAIVLGITLSLRRDRQTDALVALATALLLALPVAVLATICVVANTGGPVAVLALVVATRDFKVLYRMLQTTWSAPHLLYAKAQGLARRQILRIHIAAVLRRELVGLGLMSVTLALSVLVPIEVVFDVPGLGQLAWSAAMNRDLPVLVAVTALLAAFVGALSLFAEPGKSMEASQCA